MTAPLERREWIIASDVQAIAPIVETVQGMCVAAGFAPRHCRLNIPVAVTEALSNAILRGNLGEPARVVHVAVLLESHRVVIEVTDEGDGFELDVVQHSPDEDGWLEREDGRGLFLMRSLMDAVESQRPDARRADARRGHTLRLILHRA
ncbi:MAG: ATP-binding protein [Gemmatimonadaceae bacterium]|nr:ATP-binding protein [Gemmatimonadaceae bacterium]